MNNSTIEVHKEQWTETQGGIEAKAFVYKRLMESIRRQQKEQDKPIFFSPLVVLNSAYD